MSPAGVEQPKPWLFLGMDGVIALRSKGQEREAKGAFERVSGLDKPRTLIATNIGGLLDRLEKCFEPVWVTRWDGPQRRVMIVVRRETWERLSLPTNRRGSPSAIADAITDRLEADPRPAAWVDDIADTQRLRATVRHLVKPMKPGSYAGLLPSHVEDLEAFAKQQVEALSQADKDAS